MAQKVMRYQNILLGILLMFAFFLIPGYVIVPNTNNSDILSHTATSLADNDTTPQIVTNAMLGDDDLFNALCRGYDKQVAMQLTSDFFTDEYMTSKGLTRRVSSKYQGVDGVLDLSYLLKNAGVQTDSPYPILLEGLAYFDMSDIKVLDISDYKIDSLALGIISFPNLETLVLNNCQIETITFINENSKLHTIDLSNNLITKIDLTPLTYEGEYTIDLSCNNISSLDDIKRTTTDQISYKINLLGNSTTDIQSSTVGNVQLELGAQSINGKKFAKSDSIKYFGLYDLDYKFQIYDSTGAEYGEPIVDDTDITLPVGSYTAKYLDSNGNYIERLGTMSFSFIPDTPYAVIVWKGKEYEKYDETINGRPTIRVKDFEGKEIYYRIGTGEWNLLDETGEFAVDQGGRFNVTIKTVENGVESNLYSIPLITSLNQYIPNLLLMIILLCLFLLVIFGFVPLMRRFLRRK